ncbi:MAG: response regulator [Burkholderiaceae bacterium]
MSEPEKPVYRVAIAGLEARDARLIEIVFRHSRYNRVSFELVQASERSVIDILVANPYDNVGLRAMARARAGQRPVPVVVVVPDGRQPRGRYTIELDKLPLQLLPTLNRLVRTELLAPTPAPKVMRARVSEVPAETRPAPAENAAAAVQALGELGRRGRATAIAVEPAPAADADDLSSATLIFPLTGFGDTLLPATEFPPVLRSSPVPPLSVRRIVPPAQPELTKTPPPAPASASGPAVTDVREESVRASVLVVDDSATVRRQLCRALGHWGIEAVAVACAEEALDELARRHFDLALVDVVMPGRNGFALTRDLRRSHPSMPVILLTQRSTPIDLARGALAGCAAYLRKPIKPARLQAEVMSQLRRSLAIDDLSTVLGPPGPEPAAPQTDDGAVAGPSERAQRAGGV